ncbi:hypothetical protein KHO57_gp180 [Mycobacterium phage Phabba]|uniref:Uncharacterized protein n=1 Tax=Mycobacterium phage Phabba TaxID=2027899 RepID=A0A249XU28_9CAUD|nr:hypothetical protein KHO57_gp180 [Mycobacterium phage Phabba]ASZ74724.1 hypothetical protein SEA_PHABBA_185 [Mycobacterium phage Phabba]
MGTVRGVDERTGKFCPRCGFEFYPIMSKHFFGEWGGQPHCLPCGKICDKAGFREPHPHPQEVVPLLSA